MNQYPRLLARFYSEPLALLPEKIEAIRRVLHTRAAGDAMSDEEIQAAVAQRRTGNVQMVGRTAVVPVFGTLMQRAGAFEQMSGAVSAEGVGATLGELANDRGVKNILMVFDSPGGSVYGIPELAARIRDVNQDKPVYGHADSIAASAAYWLIAQCREVSVTPGGQVGSVGVYAAHEDLSAYYEKEGVRTTLVSAGDHKTEGHPYGPLDEGARGEMQAKVNHYYGMFLRDLSKGRNTSESRVRSDFGQGRMMTPDQAKAAGMVDRVATVDVTLKRLGAYDGTPARNLAALRERLVLCLGR